MGSLQFPLTVFSYGLHINNPMIGFQGAFFHETICMNNIGLLLGQLKASPVYYDIKLR